jgi:hypothetical protein
VRKLDSAVNSRFLGFSECGLDFDTPQAIVAALTRAPGYVCGCARRRCCAGTFNGGTPLDRSASAARKTTLAREIERLVLRLARDDSTRGYRWIVGEMRRPGVTVSAGSVRSLFAAQPATLGA